MTGRVFGAVLVLLLQSTAVERASAGESDVAAVLFYHGGIERLLPTTRETVRRLVHLCEAQFQSADGSAAPASAAAMGEHVRRHETALEIRYRQPVAFTVAYDARRVHVTRLQIPLTDTAGETSFFYVGTPGPPYLRRDGKAEIIALLRELELPVE